MSLLCVEDLVAKKIRNKSGIIRNNYLKFMHTILVV